ncbi:hypothetical protein GCM10009554_34910 [Kribbella koreensis]|uniref:Uncharacterized protein n=1 Tax=Kribbella koreensis TaxID=57909 RepID=A0ABP4AWV0_9ACTN
MSKDALYPDPPHLTIAVWSPEDEESVFGRACDVVVAAGCAPAGVVESAPRGRQYAMLQDLDDRSTAQLGADAFDAVVHGRDPVLRPLKAGYRVKGWGAVIVEHLLGTEKEMHPVAVSLAADRLGLPDSSWKASDRKAARRLAQWATGVLRELTVGTGAVYGAIGVEETLPTPSALRSGAPVGTVVFVASALPDVQALFGAAVPGVQWPTGEFFPGWHPFAESPVVVDEKRLPAASFGLGRALSGRAG